MKRDFIVYSLHYSGSRYTHALCSALTEQKGAKYHFWVEPPVGAALIGCVRDPRDIIASTALRHTEGNVADAIEHQLGANQNVWASMLKWIRKHGVHVVRYEDWFGNERGYIESLSRILDALWVSNEEMDRIVERYTLKHTEAGHRKGDPRYEVFGEGVSATGGQVGAWRELFTPEERVAVETMFKPYMEALSYGSKE